MSSLATNLLENFGCFRLLTYKSHFPFFIKKNTFLILIVSIGFSKDPLIRLIIVVLGHNDSKVSCHKAPFIKVLF